MVVDKTFVEGVDDLLEAYALWDKVQCECMYRKSAV
jgi:hypothetical protein